MLRSEKLELIELLDKWRKEESRTMIFKENIIEQIKEEIQIELEED